MSKIIVIMQSEKNIFIKYTLAIIIEICDLIAILTDIINNEISI